MPPSHLILCCPLLLPPSIFPRIRVFSNESALRIRWPEFWSLSFSISTSNECLGLISFRMDWLDLLAAQGTLKSLLQHHTSKASILQCSTCFIVQFSHPYMTTGKNRALTRQTFVGRIMSLLFNMLSRLVIAFLPRNNRLLISWLQSPSAVILEPQKVVCHCFHCFPIYLANAISFLFFNDHFKKHIYLFILAMPGFNCSLRVLHCGMQASYLQYAGPSSLIRDQARPSSTGAWTLTHWTTREATQMPLLLVSPSGPSSVFQSLYLQFSLPNILSTLPNYLFFISWLKYHLLWKAFPDSLVCLLLSYHSVGTLCFLSTTFSTLY